MCFRDTARELSTVRNCKRKETRSLVNASGQICALKNCQSKGSIKFMNSFERFIVSRKHKSICVFMEVESVVEA